MRVSWIHYSPVKGMRLRDLDEAALTRAGIPGDRAFLVVDGRGRMVNGKGVGPLMTVVPTYDPDQDVLSLSFPDGTSVTGDPPLGEPEDVRFFGLTLNARPVEGDFSEALSDHCGAALRLFASPPDRPGMDRGFDGAATLLSHASLERLGEIAGKDDGIDPRRFRMNFGIEGSRAHEEDEWIGRRVRLGDALVEIGAHVGRCAVTTRNADTGVVDLKTLHHLAAYRREVESSEPLPFGVYGRVLEEGRVRLGDEVELRG